MSSMVYYTINKGHKNWFVIFPPCRDKTNVLCVQGAIMTE